MKPKLYLETTIPSYLASRPSRDLIISGHQQLTREWFEKRQKIFDIYISQFVIDEAKGGDKVAARARLEIISKFPMLDITPDVDFLAKSLLKSKIIPKSAATDAAHIAIAAVHGMDLLLTWNCKHIANAIIARSIATLCETQGFTCPTICTPEELMGE